jgi:hypothetical protein
MNHLLSQTFREHCLRKVNATSFDLMGEVKKHMRVHMHLCAYINTANNKPIFNVPDDRILLTVVVHALWTPSIVRYWNQHFCTRPQVTGTYLETNSTTIIISLF